MALPAERYISPDEYLAIERAAETKSEYFDGRLYAMAGVSRAHSLVTTNLIAQLGTALRGSSCETHGPDMRVKVQPTGAYVYPDVSVACGEPEFEDAQVDTLLNPTVLVEVLSPTTEAYDRGIKFGWYRQMPSVQECLFVSQDRPLVERFVRQGEGWAFTEHAGLEDTLVVLDGTVRVPLAAIYERVVFPERPGRCPA
jgi:Uma2 family endonuclease